MPISLRGPQGGAAFPCVVVAIPGAASAHAANSKRVLLFHSVGREIALYDTAAAVFPTQLAKASPGPFAFTEANHDFERVVKEDERAGVAAGAASATPAPVTVPPNAVPRRAAT